MQTSITYTDASIMNLESELFISEPNNFIV